MERDQKENTAQVVIVVDAVAMSAEQKK